MQPENLLCSDQYSLQMKWLSILVTLTNFVFSRTCDKTCQDYISGQLECKIAYCFVHFSEEFCLSGGAQTLMLILFEVLNKIPFHNTATILTCRSIENSSFSLSPCLDI